MPMYFPPWDTDEEPNESNMKTWMDNLYGKFEPIEQARWNQSNIDTLFYAGEQRFINSYFNFYPTQNFQSFHFNLIQQPINMVTGFQRQHRKSINFTPIEGSHQRSADDLTKVITYANNYRNLLEKLSTAYEQSAIAGMVMVQPYLDYTDDPVNGTLDLKIWSYNSFMVDPYFREPDMSDCNFVWCQQYVSKQEAMNYFPDRRDAIQTMSGFGNRYGKFYFLPENYNLARNDLLVLSNVWYKSKRKKKLLYNHNDGMSYEYTDKDKYLDDLVKSTGFFEVIEVEVPTWKLAVVLNEQMMYQNFNPLGFDECPLIPIYWNYDPHVAQYDLRVRSLTRSMRDSQFLLNRRIILNHDISESSINSGWLRRENTIVNEEDLRYAGQGKDVIVKDNGQPLQECIQKIIPNAVPPSDMELANQLADFIFKTSGVSMENFGAGEAADKIQSGLAIMLKQGAGLMVLQKYFDQWDVALKLLGKLEMKIIQNNWSPSKIARITGREPTPEFQAKTFGKYDVLVSEGLDTTIQQQQQFAQILQLNEALGGMIPKRFILENATIQGKDEIIKAVDAQEQHAAEMQKQQMLIEQAKLEAELQHIQAKSVNELSIARERHGRAEANIGLFEERLSEITQNRSLALKHKVDALEKLLAIIHTYGEGSTGIEAAKLQSENLMQRQEEDRERLEAKKDSDANEFLVNLMQNKSFQNKMGQEQQGQQQNQESIRSALL
jgi:hypothetical protein